MPTKGGPWVRRAAALADLAGQASAGDAGGVATVSAAANVATVASVNTALSNLRGDLNTLKQRLRDSGAMGA